MIHHALSLLRQANRCDTSNQFYQALIQHSIQLPNVGRVLVTEYVKQQSLLVATQQLYLDAEDGIGSITRHPDDISHCVLSHPRFFTQVVQSQGIFHACQCDSNSRQQFISLPLYSSREQAIIWTFMVQERPSEFIRRNSPFINACLDIAQLFLRPQTPSATRQHTSTISLAHYQYHTDSQTLTQGGVLVRLTDKETRLMHLLFESAEQVISYQQIEQKVWAGRVIGESSIRGLVAKLRKKLPGIKILTIKGRGLLLDLERESERTYPSRCTYSHVKRMA